MGEPFRPTPWRYPPGLSKLLEKFIDSDVLFFNCRLAEVGNAEVGTSGSGSVSLGKDGWTPSTGTTSGSMARAAIYRYYATAKEPIITWDRKRVMRCVVKLVNNTDQKGIFATGFKDGFTQRHVGFYFENDALYMSVGDGTTQNTSSIQTFSAGDTFNLKVKFYPGDRAEFWVNGDYVGQLTSNLPSGTSTADRLFSTYIENTAGADKKTRNERAEFLQMET